MCLLILCAPPYPPSAGRDERPDIIDRLGVAENAEGEDAECALGGKAYIPLTCVGRAFTLMLRSTPTATRECCDLFDEVFPEFPETRLSPLGSRLALVGCRLYVSRTPAPVLLAGDFWPCTDESFVLFLP